MALARIMPTVSGASSAQLSYAALVAAGVHVPEFLEAGMDADFSFDLASPAAYRSRISPFEINRTGKNVSLLDNSAGKYLQIASGGLNGLLTPTLDQREMTYAGVWNYRAPSPDTAFQFLANGTTNSNAQGGESLFINNPNRNIALSVRGYAQNFYSVSHSAIVAQGLNPDSVNTFLFVAVTSRLTGNGDETQHTLFVGAPSPLTTTATGTKILATTPRALAIGNAHNTTANYDTMPIRVGRFFSGPGPRTVAQLTAMYQRAKVVAARRGIAVL